MLHILIILSAIFFVAALLCGFSKSLLAKRNKLLLCLGSICSGWMMTIGFVICCLLAVVTVWSFSVDRGWYLSQQIKDSINIETIMPWVSYHTKLIFVTTLFFCLIQFICQMHIISRIFILRKEEICITRSQIAILIACGIWFVILFALFGTEIQTAIPAVVLSGILGFTFKSSLQGAFAFIKFRTRNLLNIGDWIKLNNAGVDGVIKSISLSSIEVENWDSTTSSIPMSFLYSEQFQNLQKMHDGRTNGRRMTKEFIIDSSWVKPLTQEDVSKLQSILGKDDAFIGSMVSAGKQNSQAFREYIEYYLLSHPKVSHEPRLFVRWIGQTGEGLILQVYVFITDTKFMAFERCQSEIIEHIVESMAWFSLKLYQSPSSFDSKSSTVYLAKIKTDEE